jgi:hypothetical protein
MAVQERLKGLLGSNTCMVTYGLLGVGLGKSSVSRKF